MLINECPMIMQKLEMIDAIQRLGVDYHFRNEIVEILRNIMDKSTKLGLQADDGKEEDDLHFISLKFRLLRQYGYNISCGTYSF